ncbi:TauD/TfdA family dioxygenase [Actinocorallia herbida]|uniref:TauD/TfdA family dioxygenase n=1 Tax=Actinocorallia herbida TaxID=58109 RepID=UPI001476A5D5|nr:TauD/TfdA family dioxygenase [Actinocorallia herbida]
MRAVEIEAPTATEVLMPSSGLIASLRRTVLRVVDKAGRARHLPAVVTLPDGELRLRWDPRICTPRMGITVEDVEEQAATTHVNWHPERMLILDNFRMLHRRPPVPDGVNRILERTYVWSS